MPFLHSFNEYIDIRLTNIEMYTGHSRCAFKVRRFQMPRWKLHPLQFYATHTLLKPRQPNTC